MKKIFVCLCLSFVYTVSSWAQSKKIVGYFPSWKSNLVQTFDYKKVTHLNFSFLSLYADGSLRPFEKTFELDEVVKKAHAKGVKVLISVGGWDLGDGGGVDDAFELMASRKKSRTKFVNQMMKFVDNYQLDGVDIDWEFPSDEAGMAGFDSLARDLKNAFQPKGKLVTVAITPEDYYGKFIAFSSFQYFDFLNVMIYDGGNPHANYDYFVQAFEYWKKRGMPADKIVLGVPFYGMKNGTQMGYNEIISSDPKSIEKEVYNELEFNNQATIKKKSQFAHQNAGGIMIWELSQDAEAPYSLLDAIWEGMK